MCINKTFDGVYKQNKEPSKQKQVSLITWPQTIQNVVQKLLSTYVFWFMKYICNEKWGGSVTNHEYSILSEIEKLLERSYY